jgi:hypothetical protein
MAKREKRTGMWGFGRSPNPHIYPSPLLKGSFFSALNDYLVGDKLDVSL